MSERFLKFWPFILKWEGTRYENDPDDPGGATKYGIDQRSHPNVDIRNLTEAAAKEIYWREYWVRNKCEDMPHPMGEIYFDICVNNGAGAAARLLSRNKTPLTILAARAGLYQQIAGARPRMKKFLKGWLNRNDALRRWVCVLVALCVWCGVVRGESYEEWVAGYGLTGEDAAMGADPDGDRMPNVMEYALAGCGPTTAEATPVEFVVGMRAKDTVPPDEDIGVIEVVEGLGYIPRDGESYYIGLRFALRHNATRVRYGGEYMPNQFWLDLYLWGGRSSFYSPTPPDDSGRVVMWMRGMFGGTTIPNGALLRLRVEEE